MEMNEKPNLSTVGALLMGRGPRDGRVAAVPSMGTHSQSLRVVKAGSVLKDM